MSKTVKFRGGLVRIPNPACPVARQPVATISDRAKRYRANQPGCKPEGPKRCEYCGSGRNIVVNHRDGHESNGRKANLGYACKSCNTRLGAAFAKAGKGVRTRQRNRVPSIAEYAYAVERICRKRDQAAGRCSPSNDKETLDAVKIIRATPRSVRRDYAATASAARGRWGSGLDEVPF